MRDKVRFKIWHEQLIVSIFRHFFLVYIFTPQKLRENEQDYIAFVSLLVPMVPISLHQPCYKGKLYS